MSLLNEMLFVGAKVRRLRRYQGIWWQTLCERYGLPKDSILTVSSIRNSGGITVLEMPSEGFDTNRFELIVIPTDATSLDDFM